MAAWTAAACVAAALVGVALTPAAVAVPTAVAARISAVAAIKREYRTVALAEYFGSAGQVCSALTASGVRAYTRGEDSCPVTFRFDKRSFNAKYGGASSASGARAWRAQVAAAVAGLKVDVHGHRATAVDATHVFGRTSLVQDGSHWKFSSGPPFP